MMVVVPGVVVKVGRTASSLKQATFGEILMGRKISMGKKESLLDKTQSLSKGTSTEKR